MLESHKRLDSRLVAGFDSMADGMAALRTVLSSSTSLADCVPQAGLGPAGPYRGGRGSMVDTRLLHCFFEEAKEIERAVDRNARLWWRNRGDPVYCQSLLEHLHTLKGGAQLCGLNDLSEFVHCFEGFLIEARQAGSRTVDQLFRELLVWRVQLVRILRRTRVNSGVHPIPPLVVEPGTRIPFLKLRHRLNAVVRQCGEALGKRVELHWENARLQIDAGLLRRLLMPLEHVLRDALHHGIELPERRRALGKPERGRIELRVSMRGGGALMEIADDGAGVDIERVRQLALDDGLLAPNAKLDDHACAQFVFAPGISTEERVWQLCGRGLGLSAALAGVARLGGRMQLSYRPGLGAAFAVHLPRAAEVGRALVFLVRGERYAIPIPDLEDFVCVCPNEAATLTDHGTFKQGGHAWQLHFLDRCLGYAKRSECRETGAIVLLSHCHGRHIALVGDALEGCREVLIRPPANRNGGRCAASLATSLDDGSLVVLLNPKLLVMPTRNLRRRNSRLQIRSHPPL